MTNEPDNRLNLSRAMIGDSGGNLALNIFPTDVLFELLALAAADRRSQLAGVIAGLKAMLGRTMQTGLECAICDGQIERYRPPAAIATLAADDPAIILAVPLCETCCISFGNSVALRRAVAGGIERRLPIVTLPPF